ncbi:hypothetical protein OC846_001095 [Tilletia horrida]|uniref:Uncharacterized protein n=1 Tax=Tilletia horrida TaxID=155126 RepID=A0AAN6GTW6_9BASI|nr:hypothetical protein OC845_002282 [Tilletia horrida]KAK0556528.1 hypothetical protein OC846_001095 [Tilletia horrida]
MKKARSSAGGDQDPLPPPPPLPPPVPPINTALASSASVPSPVTSPNEHLPPPPPPPPPLLPSQPHPGHRFPILHRTKSSNSTKALLLQHQQQADDHLQLPTPSSASATPSAIPSPSYQQNSLQHDQAYFPQDSPNDILVKDLCNKRLQSIVYLKRTLEGRQAWLNTVRLSRRDLSAAFDSEKMRKRTLRNIYLGLSLAPLIEITSLVDYCKAITQLFTELESWSENVDKDRSKVVRNLFRTTRGSKRFAAAAGSIEFYNAEAPNLLSNEYSYLLTPNIPFTPDYFHAFFTLADMLQEVYYRLLMNINTAAAASTAAAAAGIPKSAASTVSTHSSTLINNHASTISSATSAARSGTGTIGSMSSFQTSSTSALHSKSLHASTDSELENEFGRLLGVSHGQNLVGTNGSGKEPGLSNGMVDMVVKVDGKLKKILVQAAKEIDGLARHLMKEELTTLELQVRNLPNNSGSAVLAPGANLAGVSSPLLGGERSAFDASSIGSAASRGGQASVLGVSGDRAPGAGMVTSQPGSAGLMSPTSALSSVAVSREPSSQGHTSGAPPGGANTGVSGGGAAGSMPGLPNTGSSNTSTSALLAGQGR